MIALPFTDQIAHILGASGETLTYTSNFLKVMFLSSPFVIVFFILEQFARAVGKPIISMIGMLSSVVLNMILDLSSFWFRFKCRCSIRNSNF